MNPQTITFGEIMLRLTPPGFERYLQTPNFNATFGGGEANVAVALATLGLNAAYVTVLPENNPIADASVAELRRFGVDTSKLVRGPGRMGVYYLETGANQRASRVVYDRAGSSAAIAAPGSIDWDKTLAGASWFHVTGITPTYQRIVGGAGAGGSTGGARTRPHRFLRSEFPQAALEMGQARACGDGRAGEVRGCSAIANEEDIQMCLGLNAEMDVSSGVLEHKRYEDLTARLC